MYLCKFSRICFCAVSGRLDLLFLLEYFWKIENKQFSLLFSVTILPTSPTSWPTISFTFFLFHIHLKNYFVLFLAFVVSLNSFWTWSHAIIIVSSNILNYFSFRIFIHRTLPIIIFNTTVWINSSPPESFVSPSYHNLQLEVWTKAPSYALKCVPALLTMVFQYISRLLW